MAICIFETSDGLARQHRETRRIRKGTVLAEPAPRETAEHHPNRRTLFPAAARKLRNLDTEISQVIRVSLLLSREEKRRLVLGEMS